MRIVPERAAPDAPRDHPRGAIQGHHVVTSQPLRMCRPRPPTASGAGVKAGGGADARRAWP
jgi:hypothetical protein